MEKSLKTVVPYRICLLARSQRYRDSLAGLLATLPGVDILFENALPQNIFEKLNLESPDMLVVAGSLSSSDNARFATADLVRGARTACPGLKIVFLVDPAHFVPGAHLSGVDLILPIDTTAGELLQSIDRLARREDFQQNYNPLIMYL